MTELFTEPHPNFVGTPQQRVSFFTALAPLQGSLPVIEKGKTARVETKTGSYTYDYADLTDVSSVILPLLAGAGFAWTCLPTWQDASRVVLRYMLVHSSGGVLWGDYPLNLGGTPQSAGSAITYGRRYCLCSVVGVAPKGDDDDATAAGRGTAQRRTPAAKPAGERAPARPTAPKDGATAQRASSAPSGGWTPAQRSLIMATFADVGIVDRNERVAIVSSIIRRPMESTAELTIKEAGRVIETLQEARAGEDGFSGWLGRLDILRPESTATFVPPDQPPPEEP